jgi:excisionase family DNA binding protein
METVEAPTPAPYAFNSVAAAAQYIGISRGRLYELMAAGIIPARKMGTRTLILRSDLEAWARPLPHRAAAS